MPCYVEPLGNYGWYLHGRLVLSCHLITDNPDLEELHRIAEAAGCKRAWLHNASSPHYDLTAVMREAAIQAGAIGVTHAEWVAAIRRRRAAINGARP